MSAETEVSVDRMFEGCPACGSKKIYYSRGLLVVGFKKAQFGFSCGDCGQRFMFFYDVVSVQWDNQTLKKEKEKGEIVT